MDSRPPARRLAATREEDPRQDDVEQRLAERKFCAGQPNERAAVNLTDAKIEELAAGFTLIGTTPSLYARHARA
jgi:hypothetical protein